MCLSPNSGVLASQKMHSTICAFSFLLYDESYSEWSSFCSSVVHNSCKTDFSCVNFKGLQSGIYIWKDLLREEFLFFIYTTGNQTIFDPFRGKELKPAFQFASLIWAFCFPLHLKRLAGMKPVYIWHNYLVYLCKSSSLNWSKNKSLMIGIAVNKISIYYDDFWLLSLL